MPFSQETSTAVVEYDCWFCKNKVLINLSGKPGCEKIQAWSVLLHCFSNYWASAKCCVSLEMNPGNLAGAACKKDCNQTLNFA